METMKIKKKKVFRKPVKAKKLALDGRVEGAAPGVRSGTSGGGRGGLSPLCAAGMGCAR